MAETLSSLFQKSKGSPVEVDGYLVRPIFQLSIKMKRQNFLIRRLDAKKLPVPGLRIKAVKGLIEVDGQSYSEIVLWADTSPDSVAVSVSSASGCELKLWNVWRADDVVQAWVGNAGIVVSEKNGEIELRCSDGVGEVDFSSLVVHVRLCS